MEFEIQPLDGQPILPKRPQPIFAHLNGRSVSFSLAPPRDQALSENGPSPFEPGPSHGVAKLLLDLRLPRPCRRPIAFTETLAASAIPPLDETRS